MSSRKSKDLFEAVFFFGKKSVIKEMRYSEFEAVLDGVVGITELANKEVSAAYLKINTSLKVHSVVTFQIDFNERGFADEDWNIPLRHLAENAGPGPDLGAGPVRLACRSQCSVSWYQRELWEPNSREINHFQLIKDAVARNKLGLIVDDVTDDIPVMEVPLASERVEEVEIPTVSETVSFEGAQESSGMSEQAVNEKLEEQSAIYQQKMELLITRQKQTIVALEEKYREEIEQVKRAMRNETQSYKYKAQDLEQQTNQNKVLLEKLQSKNARLERDHHQAQEMAETQKDQYSQLKDEYLELLRNQRGYDDEKSQQVVTLKEALTEKTIELDSMVEELGSLKSENMALLEKVAAYHEQVSDSSHSNSNEIDELNQRLEMKQNELAELRAEFAKLNDDHGRLRTGYEQIKVQLLSSSQQSAAADAEKLSLSEALKRSEFKVQELDQLLKSATAVNEKLVKEVAELEDSGSDNAALFEKMENLELVFVAYHPGAGHISLPARQLEDYLEKPIAIAAQKCAVTLEHYKSWLLHYDNTECEECGLPIKRIDTPSDFQPGISNRCSKHRLEGSNVAMFRKSS